MKDMVRTGTKIGAALGGLAFVVFGIIPGYHFGSYGTLLMLKHLLGEAVEPTIFVRLAVAVGIIFGIACMASVSIVTGSIVGTMFGYVARAFSGAAETKKTAEVKQSQ
jgi:hypothetical protein